MSAVPGAAPAQLSRMELYARTNIIGAAIRLQLDQWLQQAVKAGHEVRRAITSVAYALWRFLEVVDEDYANWDTVLVRYFESAPSRQLYVLILHEIVLILLANNAGGDELRMLKDHMLGWSEAFGAMARDGR